MEAAPSRGDGDILRGNGSDNLIRGLDGGDLLDGRGGNDDLQGGDGNDILIGGAGVDKLQGGSGEDIFRFNDGHSGTYVASLSSISTSRGAVSGASGPVSGASWNEFEQAADTVLDFERGLDTFDFSLIDANTTLAGDQNFSSIVSSFTGAAGQLRIAATDEGVAVYGDTNGDGRRISRSR